MTQTLRPQENSVAVLLDTSGSMLYGDEDTSRLQQAVDSLTESALPALESQFAVNLFSFAGDARRAAVARAGAAAGPRHAHRRGVAERAARRAIGRDRGRRARVRRSRQLGRLRRRQDRGDRELRRARPHRRRRRGDDAERSRARGRAAAERRACRARRSARRSASATAGRRSRSSRSTTATRFWRPRPFSCRRRRASRRVGSTSKSARPACAICGSRSTRCPAKPTSSTTRACGRWKCPSSGDTSYISRVSRAGSTSSSAARSTRRRRCASRACSRRRRTSSTAKASSRRRSSTDGFPTEELELFRYDALMIGSFEAAALSPEQHDMIREFVSRRGGSLLMLGGRRGLTDGGWGADERRRGVAGALAGARRAELRARTGEGHA